MSRKNRGLIFYNKGKKLDRKAITTVIKFLFWGIVMAFVAFVSVYCFGIKTRVIGDSMKPTLSNGQSILINRFAYFLNSPKRGDVVVFNPNGNKNTHYYVKRIIGVPGDTVLIKGGNVYINDEISDDIISTDKIKDGGIAKSGIVLEEDEYFVIGDNVNHSEDSRNSNVGIVKKEYIIGKAWFHLSSDTDGIGFIK